MHFFEAAATVFALHISILHIFLILVALGLLFIAFMVLSAAMVKVDRRDIYPKNKIPEDTKEVRIGFFSDTHGIGCLRSPKWIARQFISAKCDIVLFGGDCVHHKNVHDTDTRMLTEVSAILKEKGIDLIAVHGNHDWILKKEDYDKMGVKLLENNWSEIHTSDSAFALCGIADSERGNRPWGKISEEFSTYAGFRLVLVHNPDFIYSLTDATDLAASDLPCDYILSGHLHGGQVHLPGNLEFVFFRKDRIAREEGILGGEYTFRGYKGFISKGTGTGALPIRFMARPEIHILKFHI